jgi:putative transposase
VEDEKYLLTVLRYIHQNPTKAGIVEEIANYKWSSYNEYFNKNGVITDIDFVLSILNSDYVKAVKEFEEFMAEENKDKCLSYRVKRRKQLSDEHVAKLIKKIIKSDDIYILHNMNKNERNKIIKKLKQQGASIRQLARVTGLGRRIIEKA